ncbi:tRNA-splicing endonuclease subunit Sen2 isoform X2 [Latimeria chalumnae]|uniref:tRNA-splicing endonuclease subunit Sen2 isoform X2 n=1 Tax=Latimeria chalumnae TaxID=7897 RepID=UPI00313EF287
MAEAVFCAPRRKRRVFETYEASLPVPTTQEEANLSIPRVYQAELFNNHVIVRHPGDIEVLYKKGYFGKGILSRSKPEYYVSDPLLAAKWKGINVTRMPVISSAKYQHHVDWARSILQEQGLDQCTVNKTLADYTQQIDISFHMLDEKNKKSTKRNCCTAAEVTGVENSQAASDPTLASERKNSCSGTDQAIVPTLGTGKCTVKKTPLALPQGSDEPFLELDKKNAATNGTLNAEVMAIENDDTLLNDQGLPPDEELAGSGEEQVVQLCDSEACTVNKIPAGCPQHIEKALPGLDEENKEATEGNCSLVAQAAAANNSSLLNDEAFTPDGDTPCKSPSKKKPCLEGNTLYDPLAKYKCNDPDQVDIEASAKVHCHKHDDLIVDCGCRNEDLIKELFHKHSPKDSEFPPDHEYVLVQEEEEHLANENEGLGKNLVKENLVCRRNPYRIFEYLQLSLEEKPLTIAELWDICGVLHPTFKTTYMAYHYFRSKGWVPKVGLKYGTDLLLYRKGPPFYHASFSVVVEMVDYCYQGVPRRPFSWRSLCGLNRITANVSKELLLCYLIKPSDMTDEDLSSPECMRRIKVQELLLNRWVSSRERTEQDEI